MKFCDECGAMAVIDGQRTVTVEGGTIVSEDGEETDVKGGEYEITHWHCRYCGETGIDRGMLFVTSTETGEEIGRGVSKRPDKHPLEGDE